MKKPKQISLVYVGRRIFDNSKGMVSKAFCVPGKWDNLIFFPHTRWVMIGRLYQAEQKVSGFAMHRVPELLEGKDFDEKLLEKWGMEDAKAEAFKARVRAARSAERKAHEVAKQLPFSVQRMIQKLDWFEQRRFVDALCAAVDKMKTK